MVMPTMTRRGVHSAPAPVCAPTSPLRSDLPSAGAFLPVEQSALTCSAEVVVVGRDRAIGIDRKMQGLMHEEVISWTLADNPEVVYERGFKLTIHQGSGKHALGNSRCLVFIPGHTSRSR